MFSAKMADHLDFFAKWLVLDSQFGERVEHHSSGFVACRRKVLVDGLKNLSRIATGLHEILTELRYYVATYTD